MVQNVVFVFSGHSKKGALVSLDLKGMNFEKEILPSVFSDSNFKVAIFRHLQSNQ